ncbi:MAG: nucleotidyltransferase domain-containing protein [Methanobrevibacter sp.]|jgi:predicted nucleotidyltransferase|nr:nucleotidyltransferase domain-containing protein [Methanobrevibacter sp.]
MDRKQIAIDFANSLNFPEIEKVILFGSVARGEDNKNSDIDILIIIKNINDKLKIRDEIYTKVWDILLSTGELISIKMKTLEHYNKYKEFPFFSNIENEGVAIGCGKINV